MTSSSARRHRGTIRNLPSGSLRVRVYAGYDSVMDQRNFGSGVLTIRSGIAEVGGRT
jgi:hypothetical protein